MTDLGTSLLVLFFGSDFSKLAHGPRGTEAKHSLYVYRFHPSDGSLTLLNVQGNPKLVVNPAFSRFHPRLNVVYTVRTFVPCLLSFGGQGWTLVDSGFVRLSSTSSALSVTLRGGACVSSCE